MLVYQHLIEKYRNKLYRDGLREGYKEGIAEVQQQWEDWNHRRMEAKAANRPFTEPPPGQQQQQADRTPRRIDA